MDQKTFSCPHCGAVYPFKPALVNRAVRCSACKQPFRLAAHGVAEKVPMPGSPAPTAPAAPASPGPAADCEPHASIHKTTGTVSAAADSSDTHKPISAKHHHTDAAITPRRSPSDGPIPVANRPPRSRSSSRLNVHQERTRRLMTSTLNEAATLALAKAAAQDKSDKVKSERISRSRSSTRLGAAVKTSDGKELGPAVLTGEGQRNGVRRRRIIISVAVSAIIVFGLWIILSDRSPQRHALRAWGVPGHPQDWVHPFRMDVIRARGAALNPSMPIVADLSGARLLAKRSYEFSPMVMQGQPYRWDRVHRILVLDEFWNKWMGRPDKESFILPTGTSSLPLPLITRETFYEVAGEAGWPSQLVDLVWLMLRSEGADWAGHHLVQQWLAGNWPSSAEIQEFTGTGHELTDTGQGYRARSVSFKGFLVRFPSQRELTPHSPADGWLVGHLELF